MPKVPDTQTHITTTETLLRFYVFLGQYIDRCLDEEHRRSLPEEDFQQHLAITHGQVVALLSSNRVVKDKAEAEFQRITSRCQDHLKNSASEHHSDILHEEREILGVKMLTLSDLLAVFRSV